MGRGKHPDIRQNSSMNSLLNIDLGDVETFHETPNDLKKEREVMGALMQRFGWESATKLSASRDRLDFSCEVDGKTVALVEIKCRNIHFGQYSNLFVAAAKYRELYRAGEDYGLPAYLCVALVDGIYTHQAKHPSLFPKFPGGRTDRGNPKDIEMMIGIPWEAFE